MSQDSQQREAGRLGQLGRRIAIGAYLVALFWVIGSGLVSAISQVFWPEQAQPTGKDCATGLRELYQEINLLMEQQARLPTEPLTTRYDEWDRRFAYYQNVCDDKAATMLNRYRHRAEIELERFKREMTPLAREVDALLTGLRTQPEQSP